MTLSTKRFSLLLSFLIIGFLLVACNIGESTGQTAVVVTEDTSTPIQPTPTEIVISPTNQPEEAPETLPPESSIDQLISDLSGLPFDQFLDESFKQLLLREPESLTYAHLSQQFGLRDDQLDDLSDAYLRQTQQLEAAILELLRTYDREQLTPDQQLSYDIYEWDLENRVRSHQFMYNDYPLNHIVFSYDYSLNELFTELHELNTRENAEDYISRLSQVNRQVNQVLEMLRLREEAGVVLPDFIIQMTRGNLQNYLGSSSKDPASIEAQGLPVYTVFSESLESISGLSAEEKITFRQSARQEIENSFIPAYIKLIDYLDYLETIANDDAGVWKFPNGEEYYAYKLRDETSTNLTPEEVHQIGLAEVERIKSEMRQVFSELGYPQEEDFGVSLGRAIRESDATGISSTSGEEEYIAAIETIIEEADQRMAEVFDIGPSWGVEVVGGQWCCYYTPGAPDGSRPGAYHIDKMGTSSIGLTEKTTAYHEAVPGHHYQIATGQALDVPMFRKEGNYNGYVEGWALYAERLAYEMGLYEDDPYGNIGRLQMELLRAVRLVTDTGIHAKGWTREEAKAYVDETMGAPGYFSHEVDRYVVIPAQATSYKIGMLKILELRQRAMDALGDQFDIKEFHNIVIGNGSLPLEILESLIDDYIAAAQNQ